MPTSHPHDSPLLNWILLVRAQNKQMGPPSKAEKAKKDVAKFVKKNSVKPLTHYFTTGNQNCSSNSQSQDLRPLVNGVYNIYYKAQEQINAFS